MGSVAGRADTQADVELIRTKLRVPPVQAQLVKRPHLCRRLLTGFEHRLTLVVAPAGYGKTTLVASAAIEAGVPVAWLALDRDDNRPRQFLRYLIAALQTADASLGTEAAHLLAAGPDTPPEAALIRLVNQLDQDRQELVLVLDDYHVITDQTLHEFLTFLLDHAPPGLHLVLATRVDPPLPTSRLRARNDLCEVRAGELAFTAPEALSFLNEIMGLDLESTDSARLTARTEGWITGLRLAALSLRDRADKPAAIERFVGTNRHILDYLVDEVLAREPESVRSFLLQTAGLSRLSAPLCDAVTGRADSRQMLRHLEQRGLFLMPLDDTRRWFRYHRLFSDLLQALAQLDDPVEAARGYARAAAWHAQHGDITRAVDYALAGSEFDLAADLVTRHWGATISRGDIETVDAWLDALPDQVIRQRPSLSIAVCWTHWIRGDVQPISDRLDDVQRALNASDGRDLPSADTAHRAALEAQVAVLHAFMARYQGEFTRAVALAERALTLTPTDPHHGDEAQLRALALLALASAYDGAGDLRRAAEAYAETIRWSRAGHSLVGISGITYRLAAILRLLGRLRDAETLCVGALAKIRADGLDRLPAAGILHIAMAEVLIERNELARAESHLAEGLQLGQWPGRLDARRNAAEAKSRLRLAANDLPGALEAVAEAQGALGSDGSPLARAELLAREATILLRQGAVETAARRAGEAERLAGWDAGLTGTQVQLAALRVDLAGEAATTARTQLAHSIAAADSAGLCGLATELRLLRSLALAQHNAVDQANADLELALAAAAQEGYVRLFVEEGPPMRARLTEWVRDAAPGPQRTYARSLLSHFLGGHLMTPPPAEHSASEAAIDTMLKPLLEPLSPRELQVLRIMALGRSNREIANELVIAPGTVKAHSASIYRKLEVANRTEAVARARRLHLIS